MKWRLVIFALVLTLVEQGLTESCNTCKGLSCTAKTLSKKSCDDYLPPLPFESQIMFNEIDENAKYGCLHLEFYIGESVEHIQQCVLSNNLESYCAMLENAVKVKFCRIEDALEAEQQKRALKAEDDINDNGDDGEVADDDDGATESPDDDDTGGAESVRVLSFFVVVAVFAAFFF